MSTTWIDIASTVLPDAVKILGPAVITAVVALQCVRFQLRSTERTASLENKFKAREKLFEYFEKQIARSDEDSKRAIEGLGQILGVEISVNSLDNPDRSLVQVVEPLLLRSVSCRPSQLKSLRRKVVQHLGHDADEVALIDSSIGEFDDLPVVDDLNSKIEAAHALIASFSLEKDCYSGILERQAFGTLAIYTDNSP